MESKIYALVKWPDSQVVMRNERFHECLHVDPNDQQANVGNHAYMVPIDLYVELTRKEGSAWGKAPDTEYKFVHSSLLCKAGTDIPFGGPGCTCMEESA